MCENMWYNNTISYVKATSAKVIFMDGTEEYLEKDQIEDDGIYELGLSELRKEGCYVATAVYGSYNCPEVWTLRRYRDYSFAKTWYGRAFVHTYYTISPILVKWFGETKWFKRMWRGNLNRLVNRLQNKGYESTPYEDREW